MIGPGRITRVGVKAGVETGLAGVLGTAVGMDMAIGEGAVASLGVAFQVVAAGVTVATSTGLQAEPAKQDSSTVKHKSFGNILAVPNISTASTGCLVPG
jgi:hypothetical protein